MLGAISPINTSVIKERITTTATDPSKIQTFAAQTNQVIDPTKGSNFTDQKIDFYKKPEETPTDYMALIKKYAPYAIGAILLYYVISKK
jgi:hypothetical protein